MALSALKRFGKAAEATCLAEALERLVIEDNEVGEVYRPEDSKQAHTWLYKSESPFTWSSAMLYEALKK